MVLENVVSGRKDIVSLFWENKLGIDVEVCIPPSCLPVLLMTLRMIIASFYSKDRKAWRVVQRWNTIWTLPTVPIGLATGFSVCILEAASLSVSAVGTSRKITKSRRLRISWKNLAIDPRWSTPLGLHVHAYPIREKLAEASVIPFLFVWGAQNWWFAIGW